MTLYVPAPVELRDPRRYLQRIRKDEVPTEICAKVALKGPSNVAFRAVDLLRSTSTQNGSLEWKLLLDLRVFPIPVQIASTEMVPPSLSVQTSKPMQSSVVKLISVDATLTDVSLLALTVPGFSAQPKVS